MNYARKFNRFNSLIMEMDTVRKDINPPGGMALGRALLDNSTLTRLGNDDNNDNDN